MVNNDHPWRPLPENRWDRAAARHLAARLGYSIHPRMVDEIEKLGPAKTVVAALGERREFEEPTSVAAMQPMGEMYQRMREADDAERAKMRKAQRKRNRHSFEAFALGWYAFARHPQNGPQEKLVSFFENVWVVAFQGVRSAPLLFEHQDRIRRALGATYPEMCKALALSPAMIRYLDLNKNRAGSPNENFAREFFELFVLGEGNYTERDIKQAARALTGYTIDRDDEVRFVPRRHDNGIKEIFGRRARFDLNGVVDEAFRQPAAARFLPQELARFYLHDEGLPTDLLESLAEQWKAERYSLPWLYRTFFTSEVFYSPEYRGNLIKSPEQFALGLLQDLSLDVVPSPRRTLLPLRQMGQPFFNPPNVRGWVGGRRWINAATLAARRQFVESTVLPLDRERLNADELRAIEAAESDGKKRFTLDYAVLAKWLGDDPGQAAQKLAGQFYVNGNSPLLGAVLGDSSQPRPKAPQKRAVEWLLAALNAPDYDLC